jgi:hypothetical protein
MKTLAKRNQVTQLLCLIVFLVLSQNMYSMVNMCTEPHDCGSSTPAKENHNDNITRTYLTKKILMDAGLHGRRSNSTFPVYIDEQDMMDLLAPGGRRVFWATDTGSTIHIDVGYATGDTQYWSMPNLDFIGGFSGESIDPSLSPFIDSFAGANVVFRTYLPFEEDSSYSHYQLSPDDFLQLGVGRANMGSPILLDWFETKAFLPIEAGWLIEETITTTWTNIDPEVDSIVEYKTLSVDAAGFMTPMGEQAVPTVLSFLEYERQSYKDGIVTDSASYEAFIWFSTEGHRIIGFLEEGAPLEGVTQFSKVYYEKNIKPCGSQIDLGIDPFAGTLKAQNQIISSAELTHPPVQFISSQNIELNPGFSAISDFEAVTVSDPCNN